MMRRPHVQGSHCWEPRLSLQEQPWRATGPFYPRSSARLYRETPCDTCRQATGDVCRGGQCSTCVDDHSTDGLTSVSRHIYTHVCRRCMQRMIPTDEASIENLSIGSYPNVNSPVFSPAEQVLYSTTKYGPACAGCFEKSAQVLLQPAQHKRVVNRNFGYVLSSRRAVVDKACSWTTKARGRLSVRGMARTPTPPTNCQISCNVPNLTKERERGVLAGARQ